MRRSKRAQASVTVLEATLGVLLVVSVIFTFALGVPGAKSADAQAQLDIYAADAATLLSNEPPRHQDQTRLAEIVASASSFSRERVELERRVERILPDNVMFRVETAYGTAGHPLPGDVPTGTETVLTTNGEVTLRVWYV
ncbi:hypothetical protein ACFQJ7_10190 [Halovenus rubra]|uniref:Uncharacterized protein n=2 Tax=Halovenus rubra TaxID=869890 RepID=A0ACC7DW78_9EURY|nr:hypothetical protein [Halovenus rubra]